MQNDSTCNCGCTTTDDPRFAELMTFIDSVSDVKGNTMAVLQEAQNIFGFLPLEVQKFISDNLKVPMAEVYGISTFYSQFAITPRGKHHIGVCLGTACYVKGAQKVLDKFCSELSTVPGGTTEDMLFTLDATRCLGCCGLAPVAMIDDDVYANIMDIDVIPDIINKYKG